MMATTPSKKDLLATVERLEKRLNSHMQSRESAEKYGDKMYKRLKEIEREWVLDAIDEEERQYFHAVEKLNEIISERIEEGDDTSGLSLAAGEMLGCINLNPLPMLPDLLIRRDQAMHFYDAGRLDLARQLVTDALLYEGVTYVHVELTEMAEMIDREITEQTALHEKAMAILETQD